MRDYIYVTSNSNFPITDFEFIESPGKIPLEELNNLEWHPTSRKWQFATFTRGLYNDYGIFELKINGEQIIKFEVMR